MEDSSEEVIVTFTTGPPYVARRDVPPLLWHRFGSGESDQLWYYRTLSDLFTSMVPQVPAGLAEELARTVAEIDLLNAESHAADRH